MFNEISFPLWAIFTLLAGFLLYRWHVNFTIQQNRKKIINSLYQGAVAGIGYLCYFYTNKLLENKKTTVLKNNLLNDDEIKKMADKFMVNQCNNQKNIEPLIEIEKYIKKHEKKIKIIYKMIKFINRKLEYKDLGSNSSDSENVPITKENQAEQNYKKIKEPVIKN